MTDSLRDLFGPDTVMDALEERLLQVERKVG